MEKQALRKDADPGEWVGLAWAAWCAGERNITSLGKTFGKAPATVKGNLQKYARARAAEVGDVDPTAEYLDGLQHDLREALRTYRESGNPNAKVGALKLASQIRKDMAAARGVVTERRSQEITGADGSPVQIVIAAFEEEHNGGSGTDSDQSEQQAEEVSE
jgi:hypothetical protein